MLLQYTIKISFRNLPIKNECLYQASFHHCCRAMSALVPTLANPLAIVCFSSVYGIDLLVELMRHAWWRCLVLCKKNQQYRTWLQARNHHCFHVFRSSEQLNL